MSKFPMFEFLVSKIWKAVRQSSKDVLTVFAKCPSKEESKSALVAGIYQPHKTGRPEEVLRVDGQQYKKEES
ncbi:hypothetical protein NPIL_282041 [Nephila pilipes]|uniref:Uncharacterized protein n=1 Tax=Nephila pilipes TaxID=299642 RepID=A0A8X6NE22_NEPPI|nr:hypothetical protein NPIL_282041 [Nephila pilipes]